MSTSNYAPQTPMPVLTPADEVEGALVPPPDSKTNFADDEKTLSWLDANLVPLLEQVRNEGSGVREEWARIRRMANLTRDEGQAYEGRSDAYLPVYQRAMETRVSHISRGLFPTDTYIDATPVIPDLEPNSQAMKAWMMHQLERESKLRAEIKPWLRSLNNYGIGIGKVWWEKPIASVKQTRMARLPGIQEVLMNYGETAWTGEGARFKARSPFSWYIWPLTVNSVDEASLVFEDIQVSKQFINEMAKKGIWKNTDDLMHGSDLPDANSDMQEQLTEVANTSTTAADLRAGELADWVYLTECWLRMPVPTALYRPNEEKGCAVPVKVVLAGDTILEVRRNPFWHQKPPYLMKRLNDNPDSFYSVGMGRAALSLQHLINDFVNQTNDNGIYGLNPIVKYNPNVIVGPLEPLEPGRMWPMTDTNGVVFDRPPVEQLQYGLMLANQFISYLQDMSGAPAVLQGSGTRGGAKTATGAQILQGNVKGDLQDIIEDIEIQVLQPLMEMIHALGQQYENPQRWLAISGGEKVQFRREMLEGEYLWRWVASTQAVNQQMRAQQSIQFVQLAASLAPLLQQQGKMIDIVPLLRRIYEDGLGQRNFDRVVTQAPMMPGMMPGMGGPPGMAAPPGMAPQEPRSATEQAEGGGGPMVPGEGEDFGAVRQNADAMAAMLGAAGGAGQEDME